MKKVTWTAERREVPSLKRIVKDGFVNTGDDITNGPPQALRDFVDQGLAKEDDATAGAPAPATEGGGDDATAAVPVVITRRMREALRKLGRSESDIDAMTPQQAHDAISAPVTPTP